MKRTSTTSATTRRTTGSKPSRRSAGKATAARRGQSSTGANGTDAAAETVLRSLHSLAECMTRMEAKLDALTEALAEEAEDEAKPATSLGALRRSGV